tara:strand:- start:9311 stop:9892 length:582 start_codon:yes stop_codon:yes gene_type:complete
MSLIDEDQELVAAAINGSANAWEKLVKRYEGKIYNQGLRLMGNSSDAMDLTQEVFLGLYRNLHRFRGDAKFSTWIFRIAHNKAIDLSRRNRFLPSRTQIEMQEEIDALEAVHGASSFEPEKAIGELQQNNQIARILGKLSIEQRLVVELKVFQSLTFEEIAIMQDVSANTVKTRFYAALKKLKAVSEEHYALP